MPVSTDRMYLQAEDGTLMALRAVDGIIQASTNGTEWLDLQAAGGGGAVADGVTIGGDGTDDDPFAVISGSFGSDTTIQLPDSGATEVDALEMITTLTDDTPGATISQLLFKTLAAGTKTDSFRIRAAACYFNNGLLALGDEDTGMYRTGTDTLGLFAGGVVVSVTQAGMTLNAGVGSNLLWGAGAGAVKYSSANGRTIVSPADSQGNVEVGLSGAALATNATHGFISIPSCAGTPTGTPTSTTGAVPLVVNTTNNKLYAFYGAAWHDLTG